MNFIDLTTLSDAELETLLRETHNCMNKRAKIKQTEAWEKLKEALKEYLKYDTIVIHKNYPEEDADICMVEFQDLSFNTEGAICVSN